MPGRLHEFAGVLSRIRPLHKELYEAAQAFRGRPDMHEEGRMKKGYIALTRGCIPDTMSGKKCRKARVTVHARHIPDGFSCDSLI